MAIFVSVVILFFDTLSDAEDMTVGMSNVHLANAPWHVGGRPGNFEPLRNAMLMNGVHIFHEDRHPNTLVGSIVTVLAERHFYGAPAAASLTILTEEDLAVTGEDSAEARRIAPVPAFLPPEFFEPLKALSNIRDVQDWDQSLG